MSFILLLVAWWVAVTDDRVWSEVSNGWLAIGCLCAALLCWLVEQVTDAIKERK
jgi:hypothetical protein